MASFKINHEHKGSFKGKSWFEIYTTLIGADRKNPLDAEDLVTLSVAAYLTGKDSQSADMLARAHHQFLDKVELIKAVRCAFWLGLQLMFKREHARGSGWFSRAQHLLEDVQHNCAEKGLLSIPVALRSLNEGDAEKAYAAFKKAAKDGDKFNDPDLRTLGLLGCGQSLINLGKTSEGVAMLDEAMVAVASDKVSPLVPGIVYCAVIEACQMLFDIQRAQEWTTVLSQWCHAQPDIVPFRGQCLIRRSQIMHLHGDWSEAQAEMQRACKILTQAPGEPAAGEAYYQLADLYRLRGEFTRAEELYHEANKWGRKPQPGLALLRLAQRQQPAAVAAIQHTLEEAKIPLKRLKILPAYIEIMIASGKIKKAGLAADELSALTEMYNVPYIHAISAFSRAAVLLKEGDTGAAIKMLRHACDIWNELNAPYEGARVRLLLGIAYRKDGDEDSASLELNAAQWIFQQLEAKPDLKRVDALIKDKTRQDLQGLTLRELQALRLVAAGETNKAIADKLFISERTVERHLSNIFNKLGVASRTAATAHAFKHHMV